MRLIQSSILGNAMKDICYWLDPIRERFWVGLLPHVMMHPLIAWLNGYSWHQLSTIAQSWTALVSMLRHSWPTFSLFLPFQPSLFTLLSTEFFVSSSVQNAKRVSIISEWLSYADQEANKQTFRHTEKQAFSRQIQRPLDGCKKR